MIILGPRSETRFPAGYMALIKYPSINTFNTHPINFGIFDLIMMKHVLEPIEKN